MALDSNDREDLVARIQEVSGVLPTQTHRILKLLSHPEIITFTRLYFGGLDLRTKCSKYNEPWSCEKEEEARYETTWGDGWLGPDPGDTEQLAKNWCEPCRRRVLEGL